MRNKKRGLQQERHLLKTVYLFITIAPARAADFVAALWRAGSEYRSLHSTTNSSHFAHCLHYGQFEVPKGFVPRPLNFTDTIRVKVEHWQFAMNCQWCDPVQSP